MKKLMILGAGVYQVPLIKKARSMGIETVVASIDGDYPGFKFADHVYKADTTDCDQVLAAAIMEDIDGIATSGTDVAIKTLGYVSEAMKIPGITYKSAQIMTDKAEMKNAFRGKVATSDYYIISDLDEAFRSAGDLGYPVMVKACDVSGSRGISKVDSPENLPDAFNRAKECSKKDHFIVEKCVEGTEIGVDAVIVHGRPVLCLPHRKFVKKAGNTTIPGGHAFPIDISDSVRDRILREVSNIAEAAGLGNCMLNCDMFLCEGGEVSVIEAGARSGATCIPELIELNTGIDYYAQIINCAFDMEMDLDIKKNAPCMAKLLFCESDGIIESIDQGAVDALRSDRVDIMIDYSAGDKVRKVRNGTDRIGHVIMKTDDENEIDEVIRKVLDAIRITEM
ncbi:MAG: ATP-grasp domain-containing protein [Lachnospiraceae bacterium]|jgi:biotin carboxylase